MEIALADDEGAADDSHAVEMPSELTRRVCDCACVRACVRACVCARLRACTFARVVYLYDHQCWSILLRGVI